MPKLIVVTNDGVETEYQLGKYNTIGRLPTQTIQVLDRVMSKEHAIIEESSGQYHVRDNSSRNGIFVNNRKVADLILKNKDEIILGTTRLIFIEEKPEERNLKKITFETEIDTNIRSKLTPVIEREFLPESHIDDIDSLRQDYEKLRIAYELGQAISLDLDFEKILQKILDKAFELFPVDRGVILLFDENLALVPKVIKSKNDNFDRIQISSTIVQQVLDERTAILSHDATMDSRFSGSHSIIMQGIRSTMCVPLIYKNEIFGIMHLDNQFAAGAFTEKDLKILSGFATQAAIIIQNAKFARKIEEEAKTRQKFEKLLSPNLVEQVISGKLVITKGGELREATILFADIRGFTQLAEKSEPQEIVHMLNEYFEIMVEIIFKYQGTLDKFIGDEIMALWGAPISTENDLQNAIYAAVEMQYAVNQFNELRILTNKAPIKIGIGINTGQIVAGYIGSNKTMEYTAIGDNVNIASRLCKLSLADQVLVSQATIEKCYNYVFYEVLPPTLLKGKSEPMNLYLIKGLRQTPQG